MDPNDQFLKDAEAEWEARCYRAEMKQVWIDNYVNELMRSRSADDLRLALFEDADNPENITRAMRNDDKESFYDECMKAIKTYYMRNAEIDWECKNG